MQTWRAIRQDVVDAAGRLFMAHGYAATTIDEIAASAGVSRETVFKAVGPKRRVLQLWVEREAAGPAAVPLREQEWRRALAQGAGVRRKVEIAVATAVGCSTASGSRVGGAARRADVRAALALIAPDASEETVDVVHALTGPELYDQLVGDGGWTVERFERWLVEAVLRTALDPP